MKEQYHRQITMEALKGDFDPLALERIVRANLGQDTLRGQIGHDEYHFDANAFSQGREYVAYNRELIKCDLARGEVAPAQEAFGRLTHAAQDFYAHSNYVSLWLRKFSDDDWPPADEIDPFEPDLLGSPELCSGKLYYPLEVLTFIPFLKKLVLPRLPQDSHAWMNLDAPEQGEKFRYAYVAAVKTTQREFQKTNQSLTMAEARLFSGQ